MHTRISLIKKIAGVTLLDKKTIALQHFFLLILKGQYEFMSEHKNGSWKRYICRQLNHGFWSWNTNTHRTQKWLEISIVPQREINPKCRRSSVYFVCLLYLPIFLLCAIIALAIIAEQFGKFPLASGQRKFAENFGEFSAPAVSKFWGWGNIAFQKFSLIFSL